MPTILKLLIVVVFIIVMAVAGYKIYKFISVKIKSSNTWWELLIYTVLLFGLLGGLLFGGLYVLIEVYSFLTPHAQSN